MAEARRYSTVLRAEQTALTRRRILAAASRLFLERGYLGTTLSAVAQVAGVSVQTVYNVVGGKAVLLKAVYDVTLAGDDEPVPLRERPEFRAVAEAATGRECLAGYSAVGRMLSERLFPLVNVLLAQAAAGDTDLAAFVATIEGERATGTRNVATFVAERFGLRAGLDVDAAADVLWALTSPDLADRLVVRRGWGWDRFERWLGTAMADALLGPDAD
ncbi:TetR/AcrR family transcriptional regulator [Pseudonocardia charpentierae]|uniref:TetR/AcrR family transcriptional regulator n=1 Tax=Pseudonocardia charpentierae TaxID=3075545 RepID=A0ABU2N7Y5_9PSEU|nr:TetR/AcrR family transcriptional regulator [Pseudonocardia sp. DSM 45834]MDT0349846.1 TetR/AcrR family transcriptional regulator [Pseudonocardia sp. DSM 45834]